jgi:hypothetical protein
MFIRPNSNINLIPSKIWKGAKIFLHIKNALLKAYLFSNKFDPNEIIKRAAEVYSLWVIKNFLVTMAK